MLCENLTKWLYSDGLDLSLHIAGAMIVVLAFYFTSVFTKWLLIRLGNKRGDKTGIYSLLAGACKATLNVFGVVTALGTVGVDVSAMVAGLGLTGFALGFALKDILSNIISGFLIIIYQPIKIGHNVVISGNSGVVSSINIRYTTLECIDDNKTIQILIPNSKIFKEIVTVS